MSADESIGRGEAAAILRRLGIVRVVKAMPEPVMISRREADRRKAMEMVATEMQASIDRCAALERAIPEDAICEQKP